MMGLEFVSQGSSHGNSSQPFQYSSRMAPPSRLSASIPCTSLNSLMSSLSYFSSFVHLHPLNLPLPYCPHFSPLSSSTTIPYTYTCLQLYACYKKWRLVPVKNHQSVYDSIAP
ncbi:hypothetical protein SAY87_017924 [Trapa incisa]|uniref:Uncharacterized protein n=1 Tax=Trapa incisa TaxID=236973 RepID=A0AAN7QTB8_9MYRT|nr:hypothetical protein SAY87_017924 [Trapa incisa]